MFRTFVLGYIGFFVMLFGAFLIASGLVGSEFSFLISPSSGIRPDGLLLYGFVFNFGGSYAFYVSWHTVRIEKD